MPTVVDNPESFWLEARWQGRCAVCGRMKGSWEAHHVLHRQHCRRHGVAEWDTRNALRLCTCGENCHYGGNHGGNGPRVKVQHLTDDNIIFVVESLGDAAPGYLARFYDFTDPDPRIAL